MLVLLPGSYFPVCCYSFGKELLPSCFPLAYIYFLIIQIFYFLATKPNDMQTTHNVGNHNAYGITENIKRANPHEVPRTVSGNSKHLVFVGVVIISN